MNFKEEIYELARKRKDIREKNIKKKLYPSLRWFFKDSVIFTLCELPSDPNTLNRFFFRC